MGDSSIERRRPRKQEFNPFAKDAPQQARRRRDERDRRDNRRAPPPAEQEPAPKKDIQADLLRKQADARKKLVQKGDVSTPVVKPADVAHNQPKARQQQPSDMVMKQSREDRLAELRRKSEQLKKNAAETVEKNANVEELLETDTTLIDPLADESPLDEVLIESPTAEASPTAPSAQNIFKKIETNVKPTHDRRRKRRRFDKTGGGKQKPERRLNRQKYLEYKYAARDILNNPDVAEEHRSNVLGQIWAKGERSGVQESHEFIDQKVEELILTERVATDLRQLVNRMTTRR